MNMPSPPVLNGGRQYISICYFLCAIFMLFLYSCVDIHSDLWLLSSCYSRKMPLLWLEMHLKSSYSGVRVSLARCHHVRAPGASFAHHKISRPSLIYFSSYFANPTVYFSLFEAKKTYLLNTVLSSSDQ